MPVLRNGLGRFDAFRQPSVHPIERTMRELERQGGALVHMAHSFATLMIVLFSLGSLVALSGDAVTDIVGTMERGGVPSVPEAISVLVSTLLVVCCDVGLVYAAMVLRALRTRGATEGYGLHVAVLVSVSVIEAGTYLYMSAKWEAPSGWAWALIVARAAAAPLLSAYLAMATKLPITSRDILHQAELWQGIQLVRDVIAVAADSAAPLADKMELYEKSAVMTPADRKRLGDMIEVVKRRQGHHAHDQDSSLDSTATAISEVHDGDDWEEREVSAEDGSAAELIPVPALRYNARRLMDRLEVTR
jgi:hypothetical protein